MTAMSLPDPLARGARLPRQERRQQLLAAAQEIFVSQGYHAAAMDDIADRAGVSKPVLYQHFSSKLQLYLALLDASSDALLAAVGDALQSTSDNHQRVQATMQAYFDFVSDKDGAFRLIFESDLSREPAVRAKVEQTNDECARQIAKVISEDTGLGEDQSMMLAAGMIGMGQTSARHWLRAQDEVSKREAVELVAALLWRGISGFPLSHPKEQHADSADA